MQQAITVVGSGQMGRQIALNAAIHGFKVNVTDSSAAALEKTREWEDTYLKERISKGKMTVEEVNTIKNNFSVIDDIDAALAPADFVIEAVIENLEIKKALFVRADKICRPGTIIASNSSSIVPSKYASVTKRADKVAGMHFFFPALVMELVEVIKGPETSDETAEKLVQLAKDFGKTPILLKKETNGFVVNRILGKINDETFKLIEEGIASPADIDIACEKGLRHPMGPCKLMDISGIDIYYLVRVQRYAESGKESDKPSPLAKEMYDKGHYGKKTGKGWYDYTNK